MASTNPNGNGALVGWGQANIRPSSGTLAASRNDDVELVRAAQQGDREAFARLVHSYQRAVLHLALQITRSPQDAQDIFQEAFLRAYRYIGRFNFQCSFYTWIYRIVSNLCFDYLRKARIRRESSHVAVSVEDDEFDMSERLSDERPANNPDRALMQLELRVLIVRALQRLTPRERMVFQLRHYQGLKLRTVAVLLNTTEGTAKNTLFRATHKLRRMLGPAVGGRHLRPASSEAGHNTGR